MTVIRTLALVHLLALVSCTKSPLDRCIDDQMAAWSENSARYEDWAKQRRQYVEKHPEVEQETVNIGGTDVPKSYLPGPYDVPPSEKAARAAANLKCGRAYGGE